MKRVVNDKCVLWLSDRSEQVAVAFRVKEGIVAKVDYHAEHHHHVGHGEDLFKTWWEAARWIERDALPFLDQADAAFSKHNRGHDPDYFVLGACVQFGRPVRDLVGRLYEGGRDESAEWKSN